jgi:hypothetical protein
LPFGFYFWIFHSPLHSFLLNVFHLHVLSLVLTSDSFPFLLNNQRLRIFDLTPTKKNRECDKQNFSIQITFQITFQFADIFTANWFQFWFHVSSGAI